MGMDELGQWGKVSETSEGTSDVWLSWGGWEDRHH